MLWFLRERFALRGERLNDSSTPHGASLAPLLHTPCRGAAGALVTDGAGHSRSIDARQAQDVGFRLRTFSIFRGRFTRENLHRRRDIPRLPGWCRAQARKTSRRQGTSDAASGFMVIRKLPVEAALAPARADAGPASVRIEDHALIGDLNTAALVAL